jgi:hypothetical protein
MIVHRNDMQELRVVVGGHHGSVVVDVRALDGDIDVVVVPIDDHVELGRCSEFLASHLVKLERP